MRKLFDIFDPGDCPEKPLLPTGSALTESCKTGDLEKVRQCIAKSVKPDLQTLTFACMTKNVEIVKAVWKVGALADSETLTAACASKVRKIVCFVISDCFARPGAETLKLAKRSKDPKIIKAIEILIENPENRNAYWDAKRELKQSQ
ncbi:MAG: hypothetical protein ACHQUC_02105 [Chlamydiales bacterium]